MTTQSVLYNEGFFPSEGRWLFYRNWQQTNKAKGEFFCIHGIQDHSGRYKKLGDSLARAGYNFYIFDLTGYGRSEGKRGHINQIDDYIVDIGNFYAFLRDFKNMKNPFVLGHNFGATLGILFTTLGQCAVKGNILSAPLFQFKKTPSLWKKAVGKISNIALPKLSVDYKLDFDKFSHNPNIATEYSFDPFIQEKVTARWISEISKGMKKVQARKRMIQIPTLILQGELDTIADINATKNFFAGLRCEKNFFLIRNAYHELLNEICKEKIISKMLEWVTVNK